MARGPINYAARRRRSRRVEASRATEDLAPTVTNDASGTAMIDLQVGEGIVISDCHSTGYDALVNIGACNDVTVKNSSNTPKQAD